MGQAKQMLSYFFRFLKDRKFRNRVLSMIRQTSETRKKSEIVSYSPDLKEALKDKKFFFIGGCEISFLKEYLENNINIKTLHTFDYGASSNPLFEVQDDQSEIWNFKPNVVVLSHNQQIRSYFQALQLKQVRFDDQEEQLKEIKTTYSETIRLLREKEITGPIIIFTYPLAYRPAMGKFEYHSIRISHSLVEFSNRLKLIFYEIAKEFSDVLILDVDEVFSKVGKDQYIRRSDADGIHEHVTRAGATILGDEFFSILQIYYKIGKKIKCVVVDLDNTLWDGIIQDDGLEGVSINHNRITVLKMLQKRGIILAIASKNEPGTEPLINELLGEDFDLFTVKKINWNEKIQSLEEIAEELDISVEHLAFFDDSPFERDQVKLVYPQVAVYPETAILDALRLPEFDSGIVTLESVKRAEMYQQQKTRKKIEKSFKGNKNEFLKSIEMNLWIREAKRGDLDRVTELIQRTNQLNATTTRFKKSEIIEFQKSDKHRIFVTNLWDKYGGYGLIGTAITEENEAREWKLISFLFSCRAMGKAVEYNTLTYIQKVARKKKIKKLIGQFRRTDRNSAMQKVFDKARFQNQGTSGDIEVWGYNIENQPPLEYSEWIKIVNKPLKAY
ncbi:MAG: HAD-IIIC family phosphatase [Candidatus Hodarchaeales archaeon]|jgi:FkbH-like protein